MAVRLATKPAPSWRRQTGRRAVSLVEVVISAAVMTTMIVAALGAVGASGRMQAAQRENALGLSLARQLLSEIVQTRYTDLVNPVFGVEAGEERATYDDVDDYNGWAEDSAMYADRSPISGGAGWRRAVRVVRANPSDPTQTTSSETGLKRIEVTVTSPTGRVFRLSALRSAKNGYENTPGSQTSYISYVGMAIQVGDRSTSRSEQGVNGLNVVP
jgi:MSHA pilin protein MshD